MAYSNRYATGGKHTDTEVTDIHGRSTNPYIVGAAGGSSSRNNSPIKIDPYSKGAEVLSSDVVYSNEKKVRNQIWFLNKEGVIGPFVGIKDDGSFPKSPHIPIGSTSYNSHFSPSKKREEIPQKLIDTSPMIGSMSSSIGLRHLSNGEAFHKTPLLSSSIDYASTSRGGKYGVIQAQNVSYDKRNEDFRFKKNLTSNADRILANNASIMTPKLTGTSKFEEFKRSKNEAFAAPIGFNDNTDIIKAKTFVSRVGKENQNQNNISPQPVNKIFMKEPAGSYNAASMKRSLGISPTADVDLARLADSPPRTVFNSSSKIGVGSDLKISNRIYQKGNEYFGLIL